MMLFRVVALLFALTGLAGATYCGFQFMLTLAYGLWGDALLYGFGLGLAGAVLASAPWLWRQAAH